MPEITAPPKWALFLLWPFKGEPCYPQIEGDLSEEFQHRESEDGLAAARRWYRREVCRNLWSLTWRWVTIPVIILPILCIGFINRFSETLMWWSISSLLSPPPVWTFSWWSFASLFQSSIVGLSCGIICSRILRGHERMIRLVFGAYCLGSLAIIGYFMSIGWFYHSMAITVISHSPYLNALMGIGLSYLRPILMLICVWMGSIWIEHRHHRNHSVA